MPPAAVADRDEVQRIAAATLATLADEVEHQQIKAPALIVIGEVVQLHTLLQFVPTAFTLDEMAPVVTEPLAALA